jgi:hypothetical protein
MQPKTVKNDEV